MSQSLEVSVPTKENALYFNTFTKQQLSDIKQQLSNIDQLSDKEKKDILQLFGLEVINCHHNFSKFRDIDMLIYGANRWAMNGDGTCGVLFENAGVSAMENAVKKLFKERGNYVIDDGEAATTEAVGKNFAEQNVKYIGHAVAPNLLEKSSLSKKERYQQLIAANYNSLVQAYNHSCRSTVSCLLGGGLYGWKSEEAIDAFSEAAVKKFYAANGYVMKMNLNIYATSGGKAEEKKQANYATNSLLNALRGIFVEHWDQTEEV